MKKVSKKNISALIALILVGTILTSAKPNNITLEETPAVSADLSYVDDVEEYVDAYFEELFEEEMNIDEDYIKVFDSNDELLVEGNRESLNKEELQILRQADLLTEQSGTAYYQLNN